ncbi:hypothetical protein ACIQU5_09250 [Streptomyces sp. NPDC090306]|uniref:hypothetical protein n=1 Tax=Streptomyces sp. NPDC090306 TaxID=3365961 RepID=UPI0037F2089F
MTHHRRRQALRAAAAVLAATGGAGCAAAGWWAPAASLGVGAVVLAAASAHAGLAHRRTVADHLRARLTALGSSPGPLAVPRPCCAFWRASRGAVHAPDCVHASGLQAEVERGWRELDEACCLRGWESRGGEHDARACARSTAA